MLRCLVAAKLYNNEQTKLWLSKWENQYLQDFSNACTYFVCNPQPRHTGPWDIHIFPYTYDHNLDKDRLPRSLVQRTPVHKLWNQYMSFYMSIVMYNKYYIERFFLFIWINYFSWLTMLVFSFKIIKNFISILKLSFVHLLIPIKNLIWCRY